MHDVTPRADGEKRIMFVRDRERSITLCSYEGRPALNSFDNVRIRCGIILTPLRRVIIVPQTDMIYKYGLADRGEVL